MGVVICKPCSKKNEYEEIIFSNRSKKRPSDLIYYNKSKLYSLSTNYDLTESEYYKFKNSLESMIKEKGEILKNLKMTEIFTFYNIYHIFSNYN